MKRKIACCLVLLICLPMASAVAAQPKTTTYFEFSFPDLKEQSSKSGKRLSENGKDFFLYAHGMSATNVFGCNMRRTSNNARLSPYRTYKATFNASRTYSVTVKQNWMVYLRAKKDDSSTTAATLNVDGFFMP